MKRGNSNDPVHSSSDKREKDSSVQRVLSLEYIHMRKTHSCRLVNGGDAVLRPLYIWDKGAEVKNVKQNVSSKFHSTSGAVSLL